MKPKRRRSVAPPPMTPPSPPGEDLGSARQSRREAIADVPREDDLTTTESTHAPPVDRRREEPSDGAVAIPLEDAI